MDAKTIFAICLVVCIVGGLVIMYLRSKRNK
jgi:cbb3-type cytochrome oxidase subunit 3